jgi:hypothetical protein
MKRCAEDMLYDATHCLQDSLIERDQVNYINAHATRCAGQAVLQMQQGTPACD